MGLIAFLKNKFNKNIVVRGDISNHLVFVYKLKKNRFWLDTKLKVPQDFAFVIGKSGKVLDYFPYGEYDLKAIYLPQCVKKFHLDKQQKDGSFLNSFFADAYFVNLKMFEYEKWKTYRKIEMFDEKYGYYNFSLQGGFAFKINDAKKFLTALLKVYDYIKNYEALNVLQGFVAEFVIKFFDKQKLMYDEVKNIDNITDKLYESITKQFEDIGVDIEGFVVEKVKFSNGFEKHIKSLLLDKNLDTTNFENEKKVNNEILQQMPKQTIVQTYFQTTQQKNESEEIVDLEAVSSYNDENGYIRCVFCGAKNKPEAKNCHLCGEVLTKRN